MPRAIKTTFFSHIVHKNHVSTILPVMTTSPLPRPRARRRYRATHQRRRPLPHRRRPHIGRTALTVGRATGSGWSRVPGVVLHRRHILVRMRAGTMPSPLQRVRHEPAWHKAYRAARLHHPRTARRRRDRRGACGARLEPALPPGVPRPGTRGHHPDVAFAPARGPDRPSSTTSWTSRAASSPAARRGSAPPGCGGGASRPERGWSPTARSMSVSGPEAILRGAQGRSSGRPTPSSSAPLPTSWSKPRSRTPMRARPNAMRRWACGSCGACTAARDTHELRAEFLALSAGSAPRALDVSHVLEGLTPGDVCEAVDGVRFSLTRVTSAGKRSPASYAGGSAPACGCARRRERTRRTRANRWRRTEVGKNRADRELDTSWLNAPSAPAEASSSLRV